MITPYIVKSIPSAHCDLQVLLLWNALFTLLLCVLCCCYCSPGAAALTEEEIPEEITAKRFTADILGLPIAEPEKRTVKINEQLICEGSEL